MFVTSADPLDLALLQHAQELGLHGHRHVADFVEEDGSPRRASNFPRAAALVAPVKAPASWPKQLALDELPGTAAQLIFSRRTLGARRRSDGWRVRRALCPCPVAGDEHAGVGLRRARDLLAQDGHGAALADELLGVPCRLAQRAAFLLGTDETQRVLTTRVEAIGRKRLSRESRWRRARVARTGGVDCGVPAHHDDRRRRFPPARSRSRNVTPSPSGKDTSSEDHVVGRCRPSRSYGDLHAARYVDAVTFQRQSAFAA